MTELKKRSDGWVIFVSTKEFYNKLKIKMSYAFDQCRSKCVYLMDELGSRNTFDRNRTARIF